jgi:hypothetical protein
MKKITKILVTLMFASLLSFSTQAGELTVTGGVTATITKGGADMASGTGIGVSNELDFAASGELDNGYTWKYLTQLDGSSTITDDVQLTISGDMGTLGFFSSEGGLRAEDIAVGALGIGRDYASTMTWSEGYNVDGYSNIQYHTPAGLLPFGLAAKVGYVPNMQAGASDSVLSAKAAGTKTASEATGANLTQLQLSAAPIDGVSIKGDVAYTGGATGVAGSGGREQGVSANVQVNYASGPFKVGYTEGGYQPAVASGEITYYENKAYGVSFAVNESLVVSYNYDESAKNARAAVAATATRGTKTTKTSEQDTYQIAPLSSQSPVASKTFSSVREWCSVPRRE